MANEEFYEDQFLITLTIDQTQYDEVEVEVSDPTKTLRDQVASIVNVFQLEKLDNGGHPVQWYLGRMAENGDKEILEWTDDSGREMALVDYNVVPGDHLHLMKQVIAG